MRFIHGLFLYPALFCVTSFAQTVVPSNDSNAFPLTFYPRFNINASSSFHFPSFQVAPLAQYAAISRQYFMSLKTEGRIINTYPANVDQIKTHDISYISCDLEDYNGNIGPAELINIVGGMNVKNSVIFYTRRAAHCAASDFMGGYLPRVNGIFTTLDSVVAGQIADMNFKRETDALAYITPDENSYTDPNAPYFNATSMVYESGPTTAVAMIVLYSITGIITALFVSIMVTGAIRAHLHPERYGPRTGTNARGRQSRAKGIARAVLETIPIVKFGDQHKEVGKKAGDIEMITSVSEQKQVSLDSQKSPPATVTTNPASDSPASPSNPDGTDESGVLGCSICTEEFHRGEEVRVLPCNHKYHPSCVDPWLLNVSGTCPLCRIDLRDTGAEENDPPLDHTISSRATTSSNMQALRSAITGTRDERIAALRRFRVEHRNPVETSGTQNDEERRGLAGRLADRFRIRTGRHGGTSEAGIRHV